MTVVLADIDTGKLRDAAAALRGTGADVHSVWVDVSDRESVTDLARRVREDAGEAWLLVNNAGGGEQEKNEAADIMFAGLAERQFWILTHPEQGHPRSGPAPRTS